MLTQITQLLGLVFCGIYFSTLNGASASPATLLAEDNPVQVRRAQAPDSFDWSSISPSTNLTWHACFNGTECARLFVPLDHDNPASGQQAAVALIRKASPLGPGHPDYRGPILFNPGGPGGSGIELIATGADMFASIVGPQFDIVSFDPRGVGASLPKASIYKSNLERLIWDTRVDAVTDENVAQIWAKFKVTSTMARENDDGSMKYMNTYQTAKDILSIVQAYGREKLQYWGLSYGTVLGATFISMFPDKVERVVLDGVADAEAYYASSRAKSFVDIDTGIETFITGCHQAGAAGCAFWAPTPALIRQNRTKLFDDVTRHPVSVSTPNGPHGVVDIDLLLSTTFNTLFSPYRDFPVLAQAYAALARGDGSPILTMAGVSDIFECPSKNAFTPVRDAQRVIICNDGKEIPSDLESAKSYVASMKKQSPLWGPVWAYNGLMCLDWPKFPNSNFRGPFNVTTSHPILLVGNTADPVSPLSGAQKMSVGFAGSVVLAQDSLGHCSVSAPSACTQSHIRKYFVDGTLPATGTVCPIDIPVFATGAL